MSLTGRLANKIRRRLALFKYSRYQSHYGQDMTFSKAREEFQERNDLHAYMHHYLHNLAPSEVRKHRHYYSQDMRGFGEDALHAMWWTLLREFRPRLTLEIGVYRGQVVSLWSLIAQLQDFPCEVHGISPFSCAGDNVSDYLANLDYYQDTVASNQHFGLPPQHFLKAFSTDSVAIEYIQARRWNLIYIDGNHDYNVALSDYEVCRDSLADGGLLVMDDSSLGTNFNPPAFAFAGHPGPSKVVQERAMRELRFLGGVGHNNIFQRT